MAINFSVSYTFAPSTTISSSQVNTNFSDNANVWSGLEAKTKSFAALQVDATPTAATDVSIKSYVDKLNNYRRPVLQFSSTTVVNMETGINGTSGQAQILFPDGTLRTDSTSSRINLTISQNAVLSGTAQSGLRTGAVAANTWYACYAVKVTDSSANFVTVADTVLPIQANYATLNSNFGTNGWVYLGLIRYGDNSGNTTSILKFKQAGQVTVFTNNTANNHVAQSPGLLLATSAGATTLTYSPTFGTSTTDVPNNVSLSYLLCLSGSSNASGVAVLGATQRQIGAALGGSSFGVAFPFWYDSGEGCKISNNATSAGLDIALIGFMDGVLGVGANPLL